MLLSLSGISSAQNGPTFRAGVSLVHVDVEVLGENGRVLSGLSQPDFKFFDEGQAQSIALFSAEEQPLDLILLFDISGSMRIQVKKVAAVARQGLRELRPGDRIAVMVFSSESQVVAPFSDDLDAVERAIERVLKLRFRGRTFIQAAVYDAANRFIYWGDRNHRRRAVLIVTDNHGRPTRSKASVLEHLWEADALLSGLVVTDRVANVSIGGLLEQFGVKRPGGIEDFVENTGGDLIRSDDLVAAFPEMMHRIRSRYSLYYPLPKGDLDSVRTIRVELTAEAQQRFPGAHVTSRRGYRLRDSYGFTQR